MNAIQQWVFKLILDDNSCPIDDWLESFRDKVTQARIMRRIDRLGRGLFGDHKEVGGISELRLDIGPGYRIYYGQIGNTIVVLLGGGDKSTQSADISRAQQLWKDFEKAGLSEKALVAWASPERDAQEESADERAKKPETPAAEATGKKGRSKKEKRRETKKL